MAGTHTEGETRHAELEIGQDGHGGGAAPERQLQPMVHELDVAVHAPSTVLCSSDGQVRSRGAEGFFHADVRVLSRAEVRVAGREPEGVAAAPAGPGGQRFVSLVRHLGDAMPDPTVRLERDRQVGPGRFTETLRLVSTATEPVAAVVTLDLATDLAAVDEVKGGRHRSPVAPRQIPDGAAWGEDGVDVALHSGGAAVVLSDADVRLTWEVQLAPRSTVEMSWRLDVTDDGSVVGAAPDAPTWSTPALRSDDPRLGRLLRQSLDDLQGLRMITTDRPDDVFVAAGAPWYLTLFGRDSLWAARMMLPLGTDLAAGTLATLAARQGRSVDRCSQEEPGKILHEMRRGAVDLAGAQRFLPPVYFGTVDATALWVCLLHDAWRWGMPAEQVEPLLGHLEAALGWLVTDGDPDGDGFLEYVDHSGTGLSNQGWKDSGDSVRFRDGTLATAPIALCEVQGYAHEAAIGGADLLEAFGRPATDRWRQWAGELNRRFRDRFWVADEIGAYPALALDADKRPVDSLTSNVAHLLGTGLLDAEESRAVSDRLVSPTMSSGYGLRTMDTTSGGYGPMTYHCGSVWPHDTAIGVAGLVREGRHDVAAVLLDGLLAAGEGFDWRLPELYSGDARADYGTPVAYPAACRPQAWSAASAVSMVSAVLGLRPDVPGGRIDVVPMRPSPVGALEVSGLRVDGRELSVSLDAQGELVDVVAPEGLSVARGT